MYDAIIFDNDGVLVSLVEFAVLERAAREAFVDCGVSDPHDDHVDAMSLGVTPESLTAVAETYGFDAETFFAARDRIASRAQQDEIRAGRKALYDDFDTVRSLDHPLGIVSSNQQATVDFVLSHFGVEHLFETAYGREPIPESVTRKKPNTHYVDRALTDLDAEHALFVGDSDTDVLAAHNAGLDSVFIRREHRADYPLDVDPTYEIESLSGLLDIDGVAVSDAAATAGFDEELGA
ncbi:hydrolase [Haloprofundus marisrubri]|uniref:Hydrolase n=1 Tax=Haloprofundus marisrubri TaxID=1514971 RepID=A0A0W1R8E1_9EURY|nr:HAD family hydrolase [Haloprofundus marisrubri]KTG09442.1 hydrolase [Haloprofundus marisrubri]